MTSNEPWQRPLSVETIRELERQSAQLQELQRELEAQTTIADPLAAVRALVRNQGGRVDMAESLSLVDDAERLFRFRKEHDAFFLHGSGLEERGAFMDALFALLQEVRFDEKARCERGDR